MARPLLARVAMTANRIALSTLAFVISACASTPPQAPGTILHGTVTFSPITDSVSKFEPSDRGLTDQTFPPLEQLDESTLGTGNCSMFVLAKPSTTGQLGWQFAAPAGMTFRHIVVKAPVTVDSRAGFAGQATAGLRTDDTEVNLALAGISGNESVGTQAEIDAAIAGQDHFEIIFELSNTYTSDLERIFTQALRQCPGELAPFSLTASF